MKFVQPATVIWGTVATIDWGSVEVGRWVIAGLFAALITWLAFMPQSLLGGSEAGQHAPRHEGWRSWLSSTRIWAIVVAVTQMVVYITFANWSG